MSVEDLWRTARTAQRRAKDTCRSTGDAQTDRELFEATAAEKDRGWLAGPLSREQLDAIGAWVPSRRFGIRQGAKLRVIDDFSASGINDALAASETIDPADVDRIVANIRTHAQAFSRDDDALDEDSP